MMTPKSVRISDAVLSIFYRNLAHFRLMWNIGDFGRLADNRGISVARRAAPNGVRPLGFSTSSYRDHESKLEAHDNGL